MFSLLYGLWKYLFSKAEFHVLILGIDKAGKTTLLEKLKTLYSDFEGLPPDRIVPTVGLNIGRIEAHKSKLIFWDLGGQLGLRTIWEKYFEEAHAVLYVVDAASETRLEDAKSAFEKVLRHEDLQGAPVLIFANKQVSPILSIILDPEFNQMLYISHVSSEIGVENPEYGTVYVLGPLEDYLRVGWGFHGVPFTAFPAIKACLANLRCGSCRSCTVVGGFAEEDLPGAASAEELERQLHLKELDSRESIVVAISAYDGSGIREGVTWLVEAMRTGKRTQELKQRADVSASV